MTYLKKSDNQLNFNSNKHIAIQLEILIAQTKNSSLINCQFQHKLSQTWP